METLGARIKVASELVGGLDRLAELIPDMSRRSLSDYVNEKSEPRASLIGKIAKTTGVSAGWLLAGEGEMIARFSFTKELDRAIFRRVKADLSGIGTAVGEAHPPPAALVHLPIFDIEASAGLGVPIGPEVRLGAVSFDPIFLRAQGARPDQCSIITASGDSMQPAIPDGSLLIVDHSQREVKNGQIMVVNVGDDLLVKRIRRRLDGLIDLISDNPAYAPETLGPDALAQLRIVGRVVYFCRVP